MSSSIDQLTMTKYCLVALSLLATSVSMAFADEIATPSAGAANTVEVIEETSEEAPSIFKLSGFGAFVLSHSSQGLGDYVLDSTIPKGTGRSQNWAMGNDSRLGLQVSANFSPKISAVLQVISEFQADNTYRPTVEWANIKYAFTPDSYIRVGRISLPTFLYSDTRKVGYSYPWIHPPAEPYRQLTITSSDGVDAAYRFEVGEAGNTIKLLYGRNSLDRPTSISISKDLWGIFDKLEYGSTTFSVGYQKRVVTSQSYLTGITGAWIPNYDLSVGVSYDPGDWFMVSEWIQRKSTTKAGAMYVSAGYRVDTLTPYITYSQNSRGSFVPGFPPPTAAAIQSSLLSQSTVSLGLRWDFIKNMDVEMQYDQVRLGDNSNGYLANVPAGVTLYGSTFHVISVGVNFVF
jgi:opacity protein-like surface antigen